jgi:hypothetical protein
MLWPLSPQYTMRVIVDLFQVYECMRARSSNKIHPE